MKRASSVTSTDSESGAVKRRKVSFATYQKWKGELDKDFSTLTWLDCETSGTGTKKTVEKLKCAACIKYESRIESKRNYSKKWIEGADSVRNSNIKDHSNSDQHKYAMNVLRRSHAQARGIAIDLYK